MTRRTLVRASVATFALGVALGVPAAGVAAPSETKPVKSELRSDNGGGSIMSIKTETHGRKAS